MGKSSVGMDYCPLFPDTGFTCSLFSVRRGVSIEFHPIEKFDYTEGTRPLQYEQIPAIGEKSEKLLLVYNMNKFNVTLLKCCGL